VRGAGRAELGLRLGQGGWESGGWGVGEAGGMGSRGLRVGSGWVSSSKGRKAGNGVGQGVHQG
jgi:hypothetical protein